MKTKNTHYPGIVKLQRKKNITSNTRRSESQKIPLVLVTWRSLVHSTSAMLVSMKGTVEWVKWREATAILTKFSSDRKERTEAVCGFNGSIRFYYERQSGLLIYTDEGKKINTERGISDKGVRETNCYNVFEFAKGDGL